MSSSMVNTRFVRVKALNRHHLDFSKFNELCRCSLQQLGLVVNLGRATNRLGSSLGCLGSSVGPFYPITTLHATHSRHWKLHLVMMDIQLGFHHPHLPMTMSEEQQMATDFKK